MEKDGAKPAREKEYEAAPKPKAKWSNRRKRGKNDTSSRGGEGTSGRSPGKCILSSLPDAFIPLLSSSTSAREVLPLRRLQLVDVALLETDQEENN